MALLPGPAELFDLSNLNLEPGPAEFEAFVLAQHQELDTLDAELGILINGVDDKATAFSEDVFNTSDVIDEAAAEMKRQLVDDPSVSDPDAPANAQEVEDQIQVAIDSIPPEATEELPEPYQPPNNTDDGNDDNDLSKTLI